MAKKVLTLIKLQIPGGQAHPAPPVGPALGQHGVNIMEFCTGFNAQPPPAAVLMKEALGIETGSSEPNRDKVGRLTQTEVREIAETKLEDLNAHDVDQAMKVIAGTVRSMGLEVES